MYDCIVIGAGISGLGVAAQLVMQDASVLVLERAARVGGTMLTQQAHGYLMDFGPTTILHTTPGIDTLVHFAGLTQDVCFANPQHTKRYVVRRGALHPLPSGPVSFLTSRLFSPGAKLRLLKEPFIGAGRREESIGAFTQRRLGREFLDYAIHPFVAGVYAGDPARLSVPWAFPKLYALEQQYGSLLKGALLGSRARHRQQWRSGEYSKQHAQIFNFRHGLHTLPEGIAARLGQRVLLNCRIRHLVREADGYMIEYVVGHNICSVRSRTLVLAVPADVLDGYMQQCNPCYRGGLASLPYAPVVQMFLGYRRAAVGHPLDGFGVLIPAAEQKKLLGVLWTSSLFPNRAPEGRVALTAFLGGMLQPDLLTLDDDRIIGCCLADLRALLDVRGDPEVVVVKKWPRAIPQYQLGYGAHVEQMRTFEATTPGMFICSNSRGGVAVGDCIRQAGATSTRVLEFLDTGGHE
jgi:oxygen-dependent protoporphyrinogen oxidase